MCFAKFKKSNEKFFSDFEVEFKKNRTKSILLKSIIQYKDVHWYVKTKNEKAKYKELLASKIAYQLGLNAVDIIEINEDDIKSIKNINNVKLENEANHKNTYLVRLAQSYTKDNLPIKDLNEAVASELVFSLWIRRRDTHLDNRWVIDGVPVFFDFHAAFGKKDVSKFFKNGQKENGEYRDWGYAGCWRIKKGKYTIETLKEIKEAKNLRISYHLIEDWVKFEAQLNAYCKKIEQYDIEKPFNEIKDFDDKLNIKQLLIETKKTIQEDCKTLKKILIES